MLLRKRSRQTETGSLVGAGGLDVAGLLALVADTVVADLSGAVAGKVTDLAACEKSVSECKRLPR